MRCGLHQSNGSISSRLGGIEAFDHVSCMMEALQAIVGMDISNLVYQQRGYARLVLRVCQRFDQFSDLAQGCSPPSFRKEADLKHHVMGSYCLRLWGSQTIDNSHRAVESGSLVFLRKKCQQACQSTNSVRHGGIETLGFNQLPPVC